MKFSYKILLLQISILLLITCNRASKPSVERMKECLSIQLDNKAKVLSFEPLDGLSSKPDGIQTYDAIFNAEVKFISSYGTIYKTGDHYKIINANAKYIKTEKGWKAIQYDFDNAKFENLNENTEHNTDAYVSDADFGNNEIEIVEAAPSEAVDDFYYSTIEHFLDAESTRDFSVFSQYYSPTVVRYWESKNLSHADLRKQYTDSWSKTNYGINALENVEHKGGNTYDAYITYEYQLKSTGAVKTVKSVIRFVFDDNNKIKEVYGVN